jgi:hypothetical protein
MRAPRYTSLVPIASSVLFALSLSMTPQQPVVAQRPLPESSCGAGEAQTSSGESNQLPGEMSTDRPDTSDSTDVVGRGLWQLETGVSFEADSAEGVSQKEVAVPLAMLRIGLHPRFEMRVSSEGLLSDVIRGPAGRVRVTGRSDVQISAKWKLFTRPRRCFLLALEPLVSVPAGSDAFTSGGVDPMLKFIIDKALPGGFSVSANIVVSSDTDAGSRFTQQGTSASFSHALPRRWTGFVEIFTSSALSRGGDRAWIVDGGASRPIGHRLQVDVSAGRGVSKPAADWFIGAGFAVRGLLGR